MLHSALKHEAQPSVLGLDTTRVAFCELLLKTQLYIYLLLP